MMNKLLGYYEKILEIPRKIPPDRLLAIQWHKLKLSDLELIALSECDLFRKLPAAIA